MEKNNPSKKSCKREARKARKRLMQELKRSQRPKAKASKKTSKKKSAPLPPSLASNPRELEIEHVQRVYDSVAEQWHGTRYKAWPRVEAFIRDQTGLIGDFGCGNGKNLPSCTSSTSAGIGCDFSMGLCRITRQRGFQVLAADVTALPFRSGIFDAGVCIAVLHHISSPERRERTVRECVRCVKPGGKVLFYAWAFEQEKPEEASAAVSGHRFDTQDVLVPFHKRLDRKAEISVDGIPAALPSHASMDEEKRAVVLQRYCHVYAAGEISSLFAPMVAEGTVELSPEYWDTGNWAVVAKRIK